LTQGLPRATAPALTLPVVERLNRGVTRIVAHPALQSHILIGGPGIARADPDYFALFVGNHILGGGGFVSRITEAVRQQRGLAYSAYSYFAPQRWGGMFVIGMQTRRDQANEALSVTRQVLAEYVAQGPTAAELEAAKQNIVGGFPLRIDSNRKIIEYLSAIGFYQLPLTYLDDFVMRVEQVSAADIRAAFARRVDPAKMVTVVVGADRDETQTESKP
jgi:zinc protease